ncbi:1-acyl-sn-glycerol-3-phosphate acyltransferase [Aurantibacillus circumpalustris]|uniref:1-acyl-sn-glycerol-3-phosphate acyltransferase n=1 Tax=Aurantibacillus circumpalustris TaxID=3036359 RepID=UPI00295B0861|nr:1-acyl-sn-glycerol-3-phosphate acyltransferase [Aurantibacillus circumpalustris]
MMTDNNLPKSKEEEEENFDDIRAFYDHEVQDVTKKIIQDPVFMTLINYLWKDMTFAEVETKADKVHGNVDFQLEFMHGAIRRVIEMSASGLTSSGFEKLDPKKSYLFVGNHRDILLDAAILQVLLVEHNLPTSEITFGSNLKEKGFVTDFGKLNRMFTIQREGTSKELYEISKRLSAYIRHTITNKNVSVWIAQRNGRTKDGCDFTQSGLLKMLNISGKKTFSENFAQLNIVPITISYEYEPCDSLKLQELYLSTLHTKYTKAQGEDLNSIVTGIKQFKGKIHMSAGNPIEEKEYQFIDKITNENDKVKALTSMIDKRIHHDYKLYPSNHIACDILNDSDLFESFYSPEEKNNFIKYMEEKINAIEGENEVLRSIFLKMYAQPTMNKIHPTETN